jgi:hypothetical protein
LHRGWDWTLHYTLHGYANIQGGLSPELPSCNRYLEFSGFHSLSGMEGLPAGYHINGPFHHCNPARGFVRVH